MNDKNMNVLIIEDEKILADRLEQLMKKLMPNATILDKLESVEESIAFLSKEKPDLIFLDVHLSDGSSFKIFEKLDIRIPIIFTTAYDQYAIQAFKVNSIDYLLKPIDKEELKRAIDKFNYTRHNVLTTYEDLKTLFSGEGNRYKMRFMVYAGQKVKSIKTETIAYFYVLEKSIFLCTFSNEHYSLDYSLDKIELMLDPDLFFRINRRYIIHIDSIKNMFPLSNSRIKLELQPGTSEETIVSLHRSRNFKTWLGND